MMAAAFCKLAPASSKAFPNAVTTCKPFLEGLHLEIGFKLPSIVLYEGAGAPAALQGFAHSLVALVLS